LGKALLKGLRTIFIGYGIPALTSGIILEKEPVRTLLYIVGTILITLAGLVEYASESE